MKGFVSISCTSSRGWSFTSQPWHKNKLIDYDALQNAFLLVCEKPLPIKLTNSCFSALPICVCVCTSLVLCLDCKLCQKSVGLEGCLIASPKRGFWSVASTPRD